MRTNEVLLYYTLQLSHAQTYKEGYCMWYGICGPALNGGNDYCYYNKPAVHYPMNSTTFKLLASLCPSMINPDNPSDTRVCCDHAQLVAIDSSIGLPRQLLARCPACLYNFIDMLCRTTCSPDGSTFQQPVVKNYTNGTLEVASITLFFYPETVNEFFTSCKDVNFAQSNQKVFLYITILQWCSYNSKSHFARNLLAYGELAIRGTELTFAWGLKYLAIRLTPL